MRARRKIIRLLATTLATLLLAISAAPALASVGPIVTAPVTLAGPGTSLTGMTAEEASAAIRTAFDPSLLATLTVTADGHTFLLRPDAAVSLDVGALVDRAIAATEALELAPGYVVESGAVAAFVDGMAAAVDRRAADSRRAVSKRRFTVTASSAGVRVDKVAAIAAITAALAAETPGAPAGTVAVPCPVVNPKVTRANIGKTILIVRGKFRVYLYNGAKLEKSFACAVGMNRYPTPLGKFKVIKKSSAPRWVNPYSSWSRGMPSHIDPGYYNPLGLRALYLNAPGIRIHGTSKTYSMGHQASHGCIRLTNTNIKKLYPLVKVGTPVYIVR